MGAAWSEIWFLVTWLGPKLFQIKGFFVLRTHVFCTLNSLLSNSSCTVFGQHRVPSCCIKLCIHSFMKGMSKQKALYKMYTRAEKCLGWVIFAGNQSNFQHFDPSLLSKKVWLIEAKYALFLKTANSQYFFPKFSVISPWVRRINWYECHWFYSTYVVVRLSKVRWIYYWKCISNSKFTLCWTAWGPQ